MLDNSFQPAQLSYVVERDRLKSGTFQDVWSKTRFLKVRGSVLKAPLVFKAMGRITDPDQFPMTVDELDYISAPFFAKDQVPAGCKFPDFKSFYNWWSNYRSFLTRAHELRSGISAVADRSDDWSELTAHLSGRRDASIVLNKYEMIPIDNLVRECRKRGISIADLTADSMRGWVSSLPPSTMASLKIAVRILDGLIGTNQVPAELLPSCSIGILPELDPQTGLTVPPLHPEYAELMEAHVGERVAGDAIAMFGTNALKINTKGIGRSQAKKIKVALRWYWQGIVDLGIASPDEFDVTEIVEPTLLHRIVKNWNDTAAGRSIAPGQRRAMVQLVIKFLDSIKPGYCNQIDPQFFKDTRLHKPKGERTPNRVFKERITLNFIADTAMQQRFFRMPLYFHERAKHLIATFDQLEPEKFHDISRQQRQALELAMMAAYTAIVTRYPLRLATMMQLAPFGPEPHMFFPEEGVNSANVTLSIPGMIMKTGYYIDGVPLRPSKTVDPRAILQWYLDDVHPLVMKHKCRVDHLKRPDLLFGGFHEDSMRGLWSRYIAEANLNITPHMCRHLGGSILYHHGVPIDEIAELLGDKEATVRKNYLIIDRVGKLENAMDAQAKIFEELDT